MLKRIRLKLKSALILLTKNNHNNHNITIWVMCIYIYKYTHMHTFNHILNHIGFFIYLKFYCSNLLTMFCQFLLYSKVNVIHIHIGLYIYIYPIYILILQNRDIPNINILKYLNSIMGSDSVEPAFTRNLD